MSKRDELRAKIQGGGKRLFAVVEAGGETYTIRSLTLREKGENETILVNAKTGAFDSKKLHRQKCDLLCRCVVDPDDKEPLFQVSEWEVWGDVDSSITVKLITEIDKLNEGKEVEGLLGN
ncbi:hypothetical protein [Planctomycetes bacterium TBK1r]|uniref:Uncharacterized protein n=1 Tax=Stieleria magnilauensis TaxID=2527963 RepID=A0ABX5Y073_9BACT|nr:hypothetical protein TBK1r_59430 [Planctomycetes bacterium TBK1r]QDV86994.1 hypothetical protein TBK1r_60210 [Planctomycetes bacterium TBK1r]